MVRYKDECLKGGGADQATGRRFGLPVVTVLAGNRGREEGIDGFQENHRPTFTGQ